MNEHDPNETPEFIQAPPDPTQLPKKKSGAQKAVLIGLAALVLSVVFLLPYLIPEPDLTIAVEKSPVAPQSGPDVVSPSTAAEKTKYRRDAQTVLAEIITLRDELTSQNVESWGEVDFRIAVEKIDTGDQQYSFGDYKEAVDTYNLVLSELKSLSSIGQEKLDAALSEGFAAIADLNISVANSSSELADLIATEDSKVQELVARTANLPELASLIDQGDDARSSNQLSAARAAFEQAVQLDPAHQRAATSLANIKKGITESKFQQHMSVGYAALDQNQFIEAKNAFMQAGRVYPGNAAVKQALDLVDNKQEQLSVSQLMSRASELESQEEWQQAVAIYEDILRQDSSLTEARVKLIPARVRADLDDRIEKVFEDPLQLAVSSTHANASQTLADAKSITNPGPKLDRQTAELDRLLKRALLPVTVVFQSDSLTDVTLFRVKELGQFQQTSLKLKPGRYIAAGKRNGFRDVRVEFTITGEAMDGPIVVLCDQPI